MSGPPPGGGVKTARPLTSTHVRSRPLTSAHHYCDPWSEWGSGEGRGVRREVGGSEGVGLGVRGSEVGIRKGGGWEVGWVGRGVGPYVPTK